MSDTTQVAQGLIQGPSPESQVLRLQNDGDTPWSDMYANVRYHIPAGGQTFVPFYAACLWFGHPDAMDIPGDRRKQFRLEEFRRLQVRLGTYDDHEAFHEAKPKISVWTVDGTRVVTVLDDPAGDHLNPVVQDANERDLLTKAMAEMQRQMDQMRSQMATHQRADDAEVAADEIRTDVKGAAPEPIPHPTQDVVTDGPAPSVVQPGTPTAPPSIPMGSAGGTGGMPASLADHPAVPRSGPVSDGRRLPDDLPDDDGMEIDPEAIPVDSPDRPKTIS